MPKAPGPFLSRGEENLGLFFLEALPVGVPVTIIVVVRTITLIILLSRSAKPYRQRVARIADGARGASRSATARGITFPRAIRVALADPHASITAPTDHGSYWGKLTVSMQIFRKVSSQGPPR
jgi:hypothetical protein